MSDNMDLVNKKLVNISDGEKTINKQILDTVIEEIFNKNGYNHLKLKTIFESSRYTSIEKIAINEFLWDLKFIYKIPLFDVMIFILQFSDVNKLLKIINSEILEELKIEIVKNNVRAKHIDFQNKIDALANAFKEFMNGK